MGDTARVIVLCEDTNHSTFVYRWLTTIGVGRGFTQRDIRVLPLAAGKGSGAASVIERFPKEVAAIRTRNASTKCQLIAIVDADNRSVQERRY